MSKFRVGDRVRIFDPNGGNIGEVIALKGGGFLTLKIDGYEGTNTFHEKQCRRLVKKERRRVWVGKKTFVWGKDGALQSDSFWEARFMDPKDFQTADGKPWLEFVEVRRKRGCVHDVHELVGECAKCGEQVPKRGEG